MGTAMHHKTDQHPWNTCPAVTYATVDALDDALFVVTDGDNGHDVTGAQVKTLFVPQPMPWENHDGGVFHPNEQAVISV